MRNKIILSILSLFLVLLIFSRFNSAPSEDANSSVVSPLPDFLTIFLNKQASTLNLWLPSLDDKVSANQKPPEITARSALIYDIENEKVLYEKNPKEKVPMASLTKIMTAIIALESKKENDKYYVSPENLVGENTMGLEAGETLSLEELMYGLILHSGNDAAEVLASNYKGGRTAFLNAMNQKAKSLGLSDTNFTNPTGFEGDGNQYTTTYDLVVITRYALLNFPLFSKVVSTFEQRIEVTNTHKEYVLQNETNLLTSYPGVKGVKTGYTPEAGFCLVTYLDYNGNRFIGVILGSQNRREEMKELLDYSLNSINVIPPPHG